MAAISLPAASPSRPPSTASAAPPLVPGQSLVYRLQYRSQIQSTSAGPIYNPEAAHNLEISVTAQLRLHVLSVTHDPKRGRVVRLRVLCETADARVQSDAYDAGAEALQKSYRALEGSSFEFTLDDAGRLRHVSASANHPPEPEVESALREWLGAITLPLGIWRPGLKPGKTWRREVPLLGAPLDNLAWETKTTYRENQPCPPSPGAHADVTRQTCAVIVTRLRSVRRGGHGDATPPAFRRNGLRTSGKWNARGESLSYVSLATGLVTSGTASENDDIDFSIDAAAGSHLRYSGKINSASQVTLLSNSGPVSKH